MEFPPPEMSMPPPNFQPHSNFHQPRPFHPGGYHHKPYKSKYGMQVQDDFDGKRLRKSVMRKTVDYNSSIVKALEVTKQEDYLEEISKLSLFSFYF